jgi:hypothetical protein
MGKDDIIAQIVWGDPTTSTTGFVASARGNGSMYGDCVLKEFLKRSHCTKLIRAHECVRHGTQKFFYSMGLTVFTSSNYDGKRNSAAFIFIQADGRISVREMEPLTDLVPKAEGTFTEDTDSMPPIRVANFTKISSQLRSANKLKPAIRPTAIGHRKGLLRSSSVDLPKFVPLLTADSPLEAPEPMRETGMSARMPPLDSTCGEGGELDA